MRLRASMPAPPLTWAISSRTADGVGAQVGNSGQTCRINGQQGIAIGIHQINVSSRKSSILTDLGVPDIQSNICAIRLDGDIGVATAQDVNLKKDGNGNLGLYVGNEQVGVAVDAASSAVKVTLLPLRTLWPVPTLAV